MPQNGNNSAEGRNNNGNGSRQPAKDDGPKVNDGITAPKVRLVGDNITDEHDFQFKLKHAINFLQEGSKVKAYVFFRGRSILFSEQGEKLLLRFALELEEYGKAEQMPRLEGKRMIMMIAPVKKK